MAARIAASGIGVRAYVRSPNGLRQYEHAR
jgi:hypothetical protein